MPSNETEAQWAFVVTSTAEPRPTISQRTLMRRHVMRDIGYARRKIKPQGRPKHSDAQNDTISPQLADVEQTDGCAFPSPQSSSSAIHAADETSHGSSSSLHGSSLCLELDPPIFSPIDTDSQSQRVLRHMLSDNLPSSLIVYQKRWYPLCVSNSSAFAQMLGTYATHLIAWNPASKKRLQQLAVSCHIAALQSLRSHLCNLIEGPKEDALTAIVALTCHAHLERNLALWRIHMSAICNIILATESSVADLNSNVLKLLCWVETIGSYAFDLPPSLHFPSPYPFNNDQRPQLNPCLESLFGPSDEQLFAPVLSAFESLRRVNCRLTELYAQQGKSLWEDPMKVDEIVTPVIRQFLLLSNSSGGSDVGSSAISCLRSASLLYMAELRRRGGVCPVVTGGHIKTLRDCLGAVQNHRRLDPTLHLWLLTVGALESCVLSDRDYFQTELRPIKQQLKIKGATSYQKHLSKTVWFDCLFAKVLSSLI